MEKNRTQIDFAILGSGSSANSYVFQDKKHLYVVDNGFSCREFERRLKLIGLQPENIELLFLTHTHSDHMKGMELLASKYNIPIVSHEKLDFTRFFKKKLPMKLDILPGKNYPYKNMEFQAFKSSHDAPYSMGFQFSFNQGRATIITDTGKISDEMLRFASQSEILFLESNYSKRMLSEGPYPEHLKRRIASGKGHLSNEDAALFMQELTLMKDLKTQQIYLCHLSKNNNCPDTAFKEISDIYKGEIPWRICKRDEMLCSGNMELQLTGI